MESGPTHKHRRRLNATNWQGAWNPRVLHTIKLDPKTRRKTPFAVVFYNTKLIFHTLAQRGLFATVKNILRIREDDSADASARFAAARLFSEHLDVAGDMEAVTKLRNSLPELVSYRTVYFDVANNFWLVDIAHTNPGCRALSLPLKIGRCPVYLYNFRELDHILGLFTDGFYVSPQSICDDAEIRWVAEAFPHSIGMRVHKWGHVDILFESDKKVWKGIEEGRIPGSIGGLTWGTWVLNRKALTLNAQAVQVDVTEEEYEYPWLYWSLGPLER